MDDLGFNYSTYVKFFINLFALVNPIGMIPIFMSMTSHQSVIERNKTNFFSNFSASIILCTTLFFGDFILSIFGISINSFRIAGGLLIIMISLSMINGEFIKNIQKNKNSINSETKNSISIVPLSMPLIAGPGAISSTIVWGNRYSGWLNMFLCCLVIFLFSFFCWMLFHTGPIVVRYLGNSGIHILTRVMGLLLMSLGIEFITVGIKSILLF